MLVIARIHVLDDGAVYDVGENERAQKNVDRRRHLGNFPKNFVHAGYYSICISDGFTVFSIFYNLVKPLQTYSWYTRYCSIFLLVRHLYSLLSKKLLVC